MRTFERIQASVARAGFEITADTGPRISRRFDESRNLFEMDSLDFLAMEICRRFLNSRTIGQLIAEQGVQPVTDLDLDALLGAIPDEEVDEFIRDIYRERSAERDAERDAEPSPKPTGTFERIQASAARAGFEITADTVFEMDSLDFLVFIGAVEQEFGIPEIPPRQLARFRCAADLVNFLETPA